MQSSASMKGATVLPQASPKVRAQQKEADRLRAEAEALKSRARLEGLSIWVMEKVKRTKKGSRTCYYWMATWGREDVPEMCIWGAVPGWMQMQPCRGPKP